MTRRVFPELRQFQQELEEIESDTRAVPLRQILPLVLVCAMAAVASASDAIVVRSTFDAPNRPIRLQGAALLAEDGSTITHSWLKFHESPYELFGTGTWDGRQIEIHGVGCVFDVYPAECAANTPMSYGAQGLAVDGEVMPWPRTFDRQLPLPVGDSTLDGVFDSSDLVAVFGRGLYEDNHFEAGLRNADWGSGDWNLDREFDSGDLVLAFSAGSYARGALAVPEPSSRLIWLGLVVLGIAARRWW